MAEHGLEAVAFPRLSEEQIEQLGRFAGTRPRKFRAGEALFRVGDRDLRFFVIKSGEVEIIDETGDKPKVVTVHQPGSFTGDVNHVTGNPAVVSGIARVDCEAYEISSEALREILNQDPRLSDIILQALIARRQLLRESSDFTGLRVIGSRYSKDTFRIRDFLAKNRVLFTWLDLEGDPAVGQLLEQFGVTEADTPVVACARMLLLRNPSNRELAEELGIRRPVEHTVYDLAIVGSGPAGLAAAVYAASEGLSTIVLETTAPGGQAGSSMRIENYLGFPTGITGSELADRAVLQADKFGARISIPTPVIKLSFDQAYSVLGLEGGETVVAKCLLIATGAEYRRLEVEGCTRFEGNGVYYAATPNEAQMCRNSDVVLVGGGNSAGQAAVYLSQNARKVFLIIRGDDLCKSMSAYLAHRILNTPNIELLRDTTITRMSGNDSLDSIEILNSKTGEKRTLPVSAVFSFIGATPRTDWLPPEIEKDAKSFVRTGITLAESPHWSLKRQPFLLETSRPGVFAAGDVRSGSVKRVASAVGEGSMSVQFVHEYLKER
ncbi:MAG: thioredoxin reductase [Chthoniobacterales bacterium]|nr:MAG: thioredoxin reductase [Chthoniobacterales bacterium]